MGTFEIYTTGGGYYILDMMNFLAMFSSGSMFQDMLTVGIVLGVAFAAVKMVLTGNLQGTAQYVAVVAVVGALGVGPKARVIVMDSTYPLEVYGSASNVPFSVAVVAHYTSSFSYHLTRRMEALLSTPDNLTYQKHGMLFGATLMSQAARWRAITPTIRNNVINFMENCMVDGTNVGLVDLNELAKTGFLDDFVGQNAPGALAYYDEDAGTTVRCSDGWAGLEAQLNQEVQKVLQLKSSTAASANGATPGAPDLNGLTGTLEDFQNLMGMASYDATRYLKQAMLIQGLDDSVSRLISNSGNSAAMSAYQSARAEQQTRSSYQAVGLNATKWVPIIKITFEVLYYGAFPIALLLMMTPLALAVVRGYFSGFVWLAAWEPLSAILHTTMIKASEGYYAAQTGTLVGNDVVNVLSWANHMGVQAVEQEIGATAGYLMMSIPFLSFAIFFGATKMAGMATSMLNVSQGAAIDTGREAATGSLNLGNTNMHNMNANKHNTSHVRDEGRYTEALRDGTMLMQNADGSKTYGAGSAQSNLGFGASLGQTVRNEVSERLSDARRSVETSSSDFSQSISSAAAQVSDFAKTATDSRTAGTGLATNMTEEDRSQVSESWRTIEDFAKSNGMSTQAALSAALSGGAGLPKGVLSAGINANGSLSASEEASYKKALNSNHMDELSSAASTLVAAQMRTFSDSTTTEGQNASNTLRSTLDDVQSSASRLSNSFEQTQALEQANARIQSNEGGFRSNITDAFLSKLRSDGMSDDEIARTFNGKSTSAFQEQQRLVDQYMPDLLRDFGIGGGSVGSGPDASGVRIEPLSMQHRPVNTEHSAENVPQPNVGQFDRRDAHARGLYDENTTSTLNHINHEGREIEAGHEGHRHEVEAQNDRAVPMVFGEKVATTAKDTFDAATSMFSDLSGGGGRPGAVARGGAMGGPPGMTSASTNFMPSSFALKDAPQSGAGPAGGLNMTISPSGVDSAYAQPRGGSVDSRGFYQAQNITYALGEGTIRDEPVQPAIMARLSGIAAQMGDNIGIVVTSGGQPAEGSDRTGSHRHDHGNSVDFYLTQDGQRVNPGQDKELYSQLISQSAVYFEGIGHYSWGVHVGHGGEAFWGPDKTAASADPQFLEAYHRGRV